MAGVELGKNGPLEIRLTYATKKLTCGRITVFKGISEIDKEMIKKNIRGDAKECC